MGSKLEQIGISERAGLITPNLYKQDWTVPSNTNNNYSVVHTRAKSDSTTPIYGKGTGIFLDTANGGGSYDINGNPSIIGSGRLNAISINTAQWSYGPTTPYSVTNTRALSDTTTPVYGKGTGIFLDTANGGGSYDINGKVNYPGSGRVPLMNYNYSIWTFGPTNNYRTLHPHALGPTTIPTALNLLSKEGGNGDVLGKGTNNGGALSIDYTLASHENYAGGSYDDIISRDRSIETFGNFYWVNVNNPTDTTNWYTLSHPRATAYDPSIPHRGKATNSSTNLNVSNSFVLPAHIDYGGGNSYDISARNSNINNPFNIYKVDVFAPLGNANNTWYTTSHPNAKAPNAPLPTAADLLISEGGNGDNKGKGTNDGIGVDGTFAAHTNYAGGSSDDIIARERSINNPLNYYKVNSANPLSNVNNTWYSMSHPNALANGDNKGKGTNDGMSVDGTFAAHTNYAGGSNIDINGNPIIIGSGRAPMNTKNYVINSVNKPFGYGYGAGQGYDSSYPLCANAANTINVGQIKW